MHCVVIQLVYCMTKAFVENLLPLKANHKILDNFFFVCKSFLHAELDVFIEKVKKIKVWKDTGETNKI